jgi:hypothetical protein
MGQDGRVALTTETTSDGFFVSALFGLAISETSLIGTIKHVWTSSAVLGRTTVMGRIVTAERTTQSTP